MQGSGGGERWWLAARSTALMRGHVSKQQGTTMRLIFKAEAVQSILACTIVQIK
jgi:hypothetical protein